jgi:outer membrane protein assembly factor BamE (lipoprotein component of BamABCDE complex)
MRCGELNDRDACGLALRSSYIVPDKRTMRTLFLAALIGLAACVPNTTYGGGPRDTFDQSRVEQIQKGSTTKDNIIALFGEPGVKDLPAKGNETWTYTYAVGRDSAPSLPSAPRGHPSALIITFDNRGIVKSYRNLSQ